MSNDIVFINPPNSPFSSRGILIEPIDTLGLASWIEHLGYDTGILDMDVKQMLACDLEQVFTVWPKVIVLVFDYHIPLHDVGANAQINAICKLAKEHGTITVLGGKAATFMEREKLQENIQADFYIHYEMEGALKEILEHFFQGTDKRTIQGISFWDNGQLVSTSKREIKTDLNALPIANRHLVDLKDYIDVRTLLSSRGCNLQCTFCHVPGFWGWWRGREAKHIVDEMQILTTEHDAKKILFLDDNAFVKPKRMEDISKELQARQIDVAWGCLGTIDRFNEKSLTIMHEGGFQWIHYGAESGDDEQLSTMGKRINHQKILHAVKKTRDIGIRVRTSWILDMPNITEDGLKRTEELIVEQESEEIRLHFLTLRLGSILQERFQLEAPQFIHNSRQNMNLTMVSSEKIAQSVERILTALKSKGYKVVTQAHEFENLDALKENNSTLKIVSLCPLRYGLNWIK